MKKYNIIYADPPWSYYDKRDNPIKNNPNGAGGASKHYKCMKLEKLKDLPIKEICDENCILFMWATFPKLDEAIELMKSWGFKYKTVAFVWIKMKNDMSEPRGDGIGFYTNNNAEIVLIGRKGKYWRNERNVRQIILEPKTKHSEKPAITRENIIRLMGDLPRIELFAREKTEGWDVWGNEVESEVSLNITKTKNGKEIFN